MTNFTSSRLGTFVPVPHITQQTDSHCGPAVIQLLLHRLHRYVTQDQIVAAAGVAARIEEDGTTPFELAQAVHRLAPDLLMWVKQRTSWQDLVYLIHTYRWPVAVNWQGLFYDTEVEEARFDPHGDHGHYSVAVGIDLKDQKISIYDPYPEYSHHPRVFSLAWFGKRWWDTNESIFTRQLTFIVTAKDAKFPLAIGMRPLVSSA